MPPRRRLPACLLACALGAASCGDAPELTWEIEFADPTLADRAVLVEGRILSGGCGGEELYASTATRDMGPEMPSSLEPGTYGFAGRARDVDCLWFAEGCVEITLPGEETVTVSLEGSAETPACPAAECDAGECVGAQDAGPPEVDGGADDGGGSGCSPACGECERCDVDTCVPLMDGDPCLGGSCLSGACCTGCNMGGVCVDGTEDGACGTGGGACQSCACPMDRCDAGTCVQGRTVTTFATSEAATCAASGGQLFCWGNNSLGQLSIGTIGPGTETSVPTMATTAVSFDVLGAGDDHFLGIAAGALYSWGDNEDGALGHGDTTPRTVATQVGADTTWTTPDGGQSGDITCVLRGADELFCAGQNNYSQLGLGDVADRLVLTQQPGSWRAFGMGHYHVCAIQTDGSLWCWGRNRYGQLGLGDMGIGTIRDVPTRVDMNTDWSFIAAGEYYTCGLRGGDLYCWGDNDHEQTGMTGGPATTPTRVGTDSDWESVAPGNDHTCAIKTDGSLWCWGQNDEGQLGTGGVGADVGTPIRVGAASDWAVAHAGLDYTCALNDAGVLHCWGANTLGQLGAGDNMARSAPTPICW